MKNSFFIVLMLCAISCNKSETEKLANYGKLEKHIYTNDYFDIQITLPEMWEVQNREQIDELLKYGKEKVSETNEELASEMDLSQQQVVDLLSVFKYNVGTTDEFNNSFILMAEKISAADAFLNGQQYLHHAAVMLRETEQYRTVESKPVKTTVGGKEFYSIEAIINNEDADVRQDFIATVMKGYALCFVLTYQNEDQRAELEKVLSTVSFKKD